MRTSILFLCLLTAAAEAFTVRKVPVDYATIQAAINAAAQHDTVLVSRGTYRENINFRGKNIVVTSRFALTGDPADILGTVINGSAPSHPDTASVVLFISGEDSTAVIQGFTITGGRGTAWPDEHSPGTFTEGGGILAALSSPKILHNLIIDNEAVFIRNGIVSAGGGGIRVGDGNPTIMNNVIMFNRGRYGAGIVANYSGVIIRNNIIAGNSGGGDFGGGGVWLNGSGPRPKFLENNTIIGNHSVSDGGGLLLLDNTATATLRNNILWGNRAVSGAQMSLREGAVVTSTYNDIQGGTVSGSNLSLVPGFADTSVFLSAGSPLIDAGDTSSFYRDPSSGGTALFPSRGTSRNDIGAYGGPFASLLPVISSARMWSSHAAMGFGKLRPDSSVTLVLRLANLGTAPLRIDSLTLAGNSTNTISLSKSTSFTLPVAAGDSVLVSWHPDKALTLAETLFVFHSDTSLVRPFAIPLSGKAFTIAPPQLGVMYAASGTADSAILYSVDSAAVVKRLGKSGYTQILSMRRNPLNGELVALVNAAAPQLIRLSASDAESFPLTALALTNPKGMVFRPDGTLIIGTFTGAFYVVSMATGAVTQVGSNGLRVSGLAYNPVNGSLWMSVRPPGSGKDNIYRLNPVTFQATLVGTTGFGITTKDITFDGNGRLFGVIDTAGAQSYLVKLDTATAKGTVIGGTGVKGIETIELRSHFVTAVNGKNEHVPGTFSLSQNFPNPFNPVTQFRFSVPLSGPATLAIYDMVGRRVATLIDGPLTAGEHSISFNAALLSSGIYFARLTQGTAQQSRKVVLLK